MQKRNNKNFKKGFTLVETLVAIAILLTALVLPLSSSYIGISQAVQARDRLIANYLAQDAIEYIRQQIATNIRLFPTPLITLGKCDSQWCAVDVLDDKQENDETIFLKQNSITHEYGNGSGINWVETPFQRAVMVTPNAAETEYQIEVQVKWGKVGARKTLILKENMRTWMELI